MVKVQETLPVTSTGGVDLNTWVEELSSARPHLDAGRIRECASGLSVERLPAALELAGLVAALNLDTDAVLSAMAYRSLRLGLFTREELIDLIGAEAYALVVSVNALASASLLEMSNSNLQDKEHESQVENVKSMLIAMMDDPRVAVVKLAERLVAMRHAKHYETERRKRIAREALSIFAPLAGRLGIAQLKWELEDLAFRYTEEETYQAIAANLSGKRLDRERWVRALEDRVRALLRSHGIEAEVYGRAKHIYSIWRKMQGKDVSFDEVYDMMAVRVIVTDLAQCYAALGILHTNWPHVVSEFDDYVANPKENGYQSIHTAVTLEDGRALEIQIRTEEMHEAAELGVCAHWSYKGDADSDAQNAANAKMDWLRQVLEWHDELGGTEDIGTLLRHRVSDDRIYVSTPKGHVLDLPRGATVLDFAYRVHTDIGHGCRGGNVNGQLAALDQTLTNSQTVEVIGDPGGAPRREWLERELGFVHTDRARAKLVNYFRGLEASEQEALGKALLEDAQTLLSVVSGKPLEMFEAPVPEAVVSQLHPDGGENDWQALCRAIGSGELSLFATVTAYVDTSASSPGLGRAQLALPLADEGASEAIGSLGLMIVADNRDGLLHDITQIVGRLGMTLTSTTGRVSPDSDQAMISIEIRLESWSDGLKLASHLRLIRGVDRVIPGQ